MGRRVRITAVATASDYTDRYHFVPEDQGGGRTLQSYRDEFGGTLDGEVGDPFDLKHRISLAAFKDVPPDTYIKVQFVVPPHGEDFAPIYDDAIVLKEYELPEGTVLPGA